MREGREVEGPNESGRPRRRKVFFLRRVAVALGLLVLMVLIAPQAYQALVGPNSGAQAPPSEAKDPEPPKAEEPVVESTSPAEAPKEPALKDSPAEAPEEPASEESAEQDTAAKPPEDAPKEERAPEKEPAPEEPARVEEAAAVVLASEQQYVPVVGYNEEPAAVVEQYPADAQYATTEQYLSVGPIPPNPEPAEPEPVDTEPIDTEPAESEPAEAEPANTGVESVVEDAPVVAEPTPAPAPTLVSAPAPAPVVPAPAVPEVIEPVVQEAVQPVAPEVVQPVVLEQYTPPSGVEQYAPADQYAPVDQYVPVAAPVALVATYDNTYVAPAPAVEVLNFVSASTGDTAPEGSVVDSEYGTTYARASASSG